jgi:hypothetical protein
LAHLVQSFQSGDPLVENTSKIYEEYQMKESFRYPKQNGQSFIHVLRILSGDLSGLAKLATQKGATECAFVGGESVKSEVLATGLQLKSLALAEKG